MKSIPWIAALIFSVASASGSAELQTNALPPTPQVLKLLNDGYQRIEANDPEGAVKIFRSVLAIDLGNRAAKVGISSAYIKMDKYKESMALLDALIKQYPNDYGLKNNAAWLYATASEPRFRDPEKAVNLAREALLIAPGDYHVWSTLAEAHYSAGEYEKALTAARQVESLTQLRGAASNERIVYQNLRVKCEAAAVAFRLME